MVQTNAIIYYLGRKLGLEGDGSEATLANVDQVLCQTMDLRNAAVGVMYGRDKDINNYAENVLPGHYQKLDQFMLLNKTRYSAANEITMADFHLFEMLDQHTVLFNHPQGPTQQRDPLEKFPHLLEFYKRMRSEERLVTYFASKYHQLPMNNPHAIIR